MTTLSQWEKHYEKLASYFAGATKDIEQIPTSARQAELRANRLEHLSATLMKMHVALSFICELREEKEDSDTQTEV